MVYGACGAGGRRRRSRRRFENAPLGARSVNKEWLVQPVWAGCEAAAARWGLTPLVAQILHNRGVELDENPSVFLSPQLKGLIPPDQLPGASAAAERIAAAVRDKKSIVIYGDYDVDGITALAILFHVLRLAGNEPRFYVPHRIEEGYGINIEAIRGLLADGADLIISVDCGVTAVEAARVVREAGRELIISDHHQPGETLPEDTIIVHPTVGGSYPNEDLCGAGVAFKLAWEVARVLCGSDKVSEPYRVLLRDLLALAALGTIADVVPLTGENRIITRCGLALLRSTPFVGMRVLIESAGLTGEKVSSYDVGFKLAPRINAAGRMGHARLAVELLTRADESRSKEIALYLDEQNRARQSTERRITRQAMEMIEKGDLASDTRRGIVLADEAWHAGVIGIVASRIVNKYHRPAMMIALKGDTGQGSGRSINRFDLNEALRSCDEHLIQYGGHAMAAGLKIEKDRVAGFAEAFVDYANRTLTGADLREKLQIDAEVELGALDFKTTETLLGLGPFGRGNPSPRLATGWVELAAEPRCVGKTGNHVQATFSDGVAVLKAIAFGQGEQLEALKKHRRCRLAFRPMINDFNGRRTVEMEVLDFQFPS